MAFVSTLGISVKLIGKGEVNWEEDGPGIGYNPTYYSSHETYIDSTIILYGKGKKKILGFKCE